MSITNGDSIDGPTIRAHAKTTILLGHKYNGNDTRAYAFTYMSVVDELLYLPLDLLSFFGVDTVGSLVLKRCARDEVDPMINATYRRETGR